MDGFRSGNVRISEFDSVSTFPEGMVITLIAQGVNYKMDILDFITSLNAPGSVASIGDGVPIYNLDGESNQIRGLLGTGGLESFTGAGGNFSIVDGIINSTIQGGDPYQVVNDTEIIILKESDSDFFIVFKDNAPIMSRVQIHLEQSTSAATLRTTDGSQFVSGAVLKGDSFLQSGLVSTSFVKVTDDFWMNDSVFFVAEGVTLTPLQDAA